MGRGILWIGADLAGGVKLRGASSCGKASGKAPGGFNFFGAFNAAETRLHGGS